MQISKPPATAEPLIYSIVVHGIVLVLVSLGLPGFQPDPIRIAPPVSVELVELDELTQTDKVSAPKPESDKPDKPEEAPPTPKKPAPPKVDSEQAPDLSEPKAPDIKDETESAQPLPKPEKLEPLKDKPKPPPRKPQAPEQKASKQNTNTFESLLKNLTPDVPEEKETPAEETPEKPEPDSAEKSQIAKLAEKLTISEEDALRRQLSKCWNVMAGAKYAEDLVVEVRVTMNPDRTVNQASIMDKGRYNRDSHFRAAADAAVRALRNPRCTPLQLPPDKYEEWKTIVITFDPRDML